jgi:myo-inositol catabolism protein IolS
MAMTYRRLGKTELSVSAVGIGSWQFSNVWGKQFTRAEVAAILSRARELGINFIDTAECYGHHLSEHFIGKSIAGQRDQWIIATKFGHDNFNELNDENYGPEQVLLQLEDSLRELRTDYIDIYQLHSAPDKFFDNDALWTMLDKQVSAGKVRFLGNAIASAGNHLQVKKSREFGISVIQTTYNMVKTKAEQTVFPLAEELDLGVIAGAPLCSGFLCGRYQQGHVFPGDDVRGLRQSAGVERDLVAALAALRDKPDGVDPAIWAISWCLKPPRVATAIPGIKSLDQLETNARAGSLAP